MHTCNCFSGKLNINISMHTDSPFILMPFGNSFDSCLVADHFLQWVLGWNTWVMWFLTPSMHGLPCLPVFHITRCSTTLFVGVCALTPESCEEYSFFWLVCHANSLWFFLCIQLRLCVWQAETFLYLNLGTLPGYAQVVSTSKNFSLPHLHKHCLKLTEHFKVAELSLSKLQNWAFL